jgi:hypothetical protein
MREMARIVDLIGKFTGLLDEGTRINVLVQQERAPATEQSLMLKRHSLEKRLALRRLIAKADGGRRRRALNRRARVVGLGSRRRICARCLYARQRKKIDYKSILSEWYAI